MAEPSLMSRLGDSEAPFRFKKGDRVAWRRFDSTIDFDHSGVVTDGICEHQPGSGYFHATYVVRRSDGSSFGADQHFLVRI